MNLQESGSKQLEYMVKPKMKGTDYVFIFLKLGGALRNSLLLDAVGSSACGNY